MVSMQRCYSGEHILQISEVEEHITRYGVRGEKIFPSERRGVASKGGDASWP